MSSNKFMNFLKHNVISFYTYQIFMSKLSMKTVWPTKPSEFNVGYLVR